MMAQNHLNADLMRSKDLLKDIVLQHRLCRSDFFLCLPFCNPFALSAAAMQLFAHQNLATGLMTHLLKSN